jgi:hypothetical protein
MARISFPVPPEKFLEAAGLDFNAPTTLDDGRVVSAGEALIQGPPSAAMYREAQGIVAWLREQGASNADCVADYDASKDRPGGLMVRWGGEVTAFEVAEKCGVAGLLPGFLQLLPDDDWDLRYKAPKEVPLQLREVKQPGPRSRLSPLAGRLAPC